MRRISLILSLCLIVLFFATSPAFAFRYWGAKPLAMGGAFTAVANDTNAMHWNPAGLTVFNDRKTAAFSFNYERNEYVLRDYEFLHPELFEDNEDNEFIDEVYYSEEDPVNLDQKMINDWYHLALVDGKTTRVLVAGFAFTGLNFPSHTFREGEDYSFDLSVAGGMADMLSFGLTGRYVQTKADLNGEFDMDLGALLRVGEIIGIGIVGRNMFGNDNPMIVRRELAMGLAGFVLDYATISVDATKVFDVADAQEGSFNWAFGVEGIVARVLALRGGFNWDRVNEARLWSVGAAYVDPNATLAYTFQNDVDEVTNFTHSIQLSMFW